MSDSTDVLQGQPHELAFQKYALRVASGPDAGKEYVAEASEVAVGTDPANQLVLTDPAVSKHHFIIVSTGIGQLLRDLDSTNGTTVAGLRAREIYLKPGAVIGVGLSSLRFEALADTILEPLSEGASWGRALGRSPAMRRIFAALARIAPSDTTVLIEGETGSGKGLLAEAIHAASPRRTAPFVVVDCAAIPPSLIESELFGHERGAFTGALAARTGAFEAAQGGTVFLDEIGELPLDLQPKLLRALEEREIKRVGGVDRIRLEVRIVAATNRDLRQEVNRGAFRSDLYYRLNTVRLRVPPLRERREDVPMLVGYFYRQLSPDAVEPPASLVAELARHDWPGNVRELRGAVERAVLLDDPSLWRELAGGEPAPAAPPGPGVASDLGLSFRAAKELAVRRWEGAYLGALMERHGGNLSAAARAARTDRNYLRELLRRHNLRAKDEG
jgi:DNA-binding NtrC family response regulator